MCVEFTINFSAQVGCGDLERFNVSSHFSSCTPKNSKAFMHTKEIAFSDQTQGYWFRNFHLRPENAFSMRAYLEGSKHTLPSSQRYFLYMIRFDKESFNQGMLDHKFSTFRRIPCDESIVLNSPYKWSP